MEKYQKREFCIAKKCIVLEEIELDPKAKERCKEDCEFTAWEFHDWLQEQGFSIIKFDDDEKPEKPDLLTRYIITPECPNCAHGDVVYRGFFDLDDYYECVKCGWIKKNSS